MGIRLDGDDEMVLKTTGNFGTDTEPDNSKEMKQLGLGKEAPAKSTQPDSAENSSVKAKNAGLSAIAAKAAAMKG